MHTACMALFLAVADIGDVKAKSDKKRCKFLEVFDPPCGNCLANLDGSVP